MSIQAEDRPKAFATQFLSTSGSVAQYGAFDFKPGAIVSTNWASVQSWQLFQLEVITTCMLSLESISNVFIRWIMPLFIFFQRSRGDRNYLYLLTDFSLKNSFMVQTCLLFVCICVLQGKFKMQVKANREIEDESVCKLDPNQKEGTMRVKPTTFNAAVNVKASVLCPVCDCEKVDSHSTVKHEKNYD